MEKQPEKPKNKFLGLSELAERWGCHPVTLSRYVHRLKDELPLYRHGQKLFTPAQYKKLAELLGFDI